MFKKKFMAVAAAVASLALVVPSFSFSATAASGDVIGVGGKAVKLATDLENFDDGLRVGQKPDTVFSSGDNEDGKGYNFTIKNGAGVDGSKALTFGVVEGVLGEDTTYEPNATYILDKDQGVGTDYQGATDLVFWIDCTKYYDSQLSFQLIFSEWDYNTDGTAVMQDEKTVKCVHKGIHHSTVYTLSEGSTEWSSFDTGDSYFITLDNTFKGYVRVPIDQFENYWGDTETDGSTTNLKHVHDIGFYHSFNANDETDDGYAFAIDNIGFAGDYTLPTTTTEPTTTTTEPSTTAPTTIGSETTATTTLSNTTASTPEEESTTLAPVDTTTTGTEESPKTGEKPIAAALAVAVAFAGVLVAARKKSAF